MIPTAQSYDAMTMAYRFFNERLFNNQLPELLISYQRKANCKGFASSNRWVDRDGNMVHELGLNPSYFATRPAEEVLGTLIHEAVHIFQFQTGTPGRSRYHNLQWRAMMADVGMIASHDGYPFGKQTGDSMTHYFLWDGPSWRAVRELLDERDFSIPWLDRCPEKGAFKLRLFDDEFRPRSIKGKILGDPFDRDAWNEAKRTATEPPLPKTDPNDPDAAEPALSGDRVKELLVDPEAEQRRKASNSSKTPHDCIKPGCKFTIWGTPGIPVGCYCGNNGGQFVQRPAGEKAKPRGAVEVIQPSPAQKTAPPVRKKGSWRASMNAPKRCLSTRRGSGARRRLIRESRGARTLLYRVNKAA